MTLHMGISTSADQLVDAKTGDRFILKYNPAAPSLPSEASFAALEDWKASGLSDVFDPPLIALPAWEYENSDKVEQNTLITSNQTVRIKAGLVFGGDDGEGGIDGELDVMFGAPDQPVNPRLQQLFGGIVPAYRKRFTAVFDGLICSMSKYPKPWSFRVRRALQGWDGAPWYSAKAKIILDGGNIHAMNPAHIIYECLTNRDWGRGTPAAKLDDAAFRACADVLFTENFGLCMKWIRQGEVGAFIDEVLRHIGANLFPSRTTGLWTLRLVRNDYNPATISLFTPSTGLISIDEDDNAATVVSANEVVVNYTRPQDNSIGSVRISNAAAIRAAGGILSEQIEYSGLPTSELALRVAQRDLRAKFGVKKFKVRLDRRGYKVEPGGVFRISDPARGITNLILRAGRIEDGALSEGMVTITAVTDVFGLPANSYGAVQPPLYTPPNLNPEPVAVRVVAEATHRDLITAVPSATLESITPGTNFITALASAPSGYSFGYQLDTRVGTVAWTSTDADFTPNAILETAIQKGAAPVAVALSDLNGMDNVAVGSSALINGEIFRVTVINTITKTATLARGCVDTVPAAHSVGSRVWFYSDELGVDTTEYATGVAVQVRMLTKTGAGRLPAGSAATDTHTITQRRERPYPPGNVKINGAAYPEKISGALSITWSHRDRLLQADQLVDTSMGNVGPEPGVGYSINIKGEGGVTIKNIDTTAATLSVSDIEEFASGKFDAPSGRSLRKLGLAVIDNTFSRALDAYASVGKASNGSVSGYIGQAANYKFAAAGGTTYTATVGSIGGGISNTPFSLKPGIYYSAVPSGEDAFTWIDPYVGWAVSRYSQLSYYGRTRGLIIDRRTDPQYKYQAWTRSAELRYWAQTENSTRLITKVQVLLDRISITDMSDGSITLQRILCDEFYFADGAQFDNPNGAFGTGMAAAGSDGIQYAAAAGSLLYVSYYGADATTSTAGKVVDITNLLTDHITVATSYTLKTKVLSIDGSGNLTLLDTKNGAFSIDQLTASLAIELQQSTKQVRTINMSTGVVVATLVTLPDTVLSIVSDFVNEQFYALTKNASVITLRKYDSTGTQIATATFAGSGTAYQLSVSQNYIYVYDTTGKQLYQSSKQLSGFALISAPGIFDQYLITPSLLTIESFDAFPGDNLVHMTVASPYGTGAYSRLASMLDESGLSSENIDVATPRLNDVITVELDSVRDGLRSHQKHTIQIPRRGYGLRYGESYED